MNYNKCTKMNIQLGNFTSKMFMCQRKETKKIQLEEKRKKKAPASLDVKILGPSILRFVW